MFDLGVKPWVDNPVIHRPVSAVTHCPKAAVTKQGRTTYTFVTDGLEAAIAPARRLRAQEGAIMVLESEFVEALRRYLPVFLRLALGIGFLSAVADRFGFLGPSGTRNIAWGDFAHFTEYTGQLNPWAPAALVPTLAWVSTVAELVLGVALILGLFTRWAALLSGILLLLFAGGMTVGTGVKAALNASVFSAAAAAFALVVLGPGPWSVDGPRG